MVHPQAWEVSAASVQGQRILLVDDTYTTGAHLHSAAAALLDRGARSVALLVIGRRVHQGWGSGQAIPRLASRGSPPVGRVAPGWWRGSAPVARAGLLADRVQGLASFRGEGL